MMNRKHTNNKKKKIILITTLVIIVIAVLSMCGYSLLNKVNDIKIMFVVGGAARPSEELIETVPGNVKDYKIKDHEVANGIVIKEFKPDGVVLVKDGETEEYNYNEDIWVDGHTGCDLSTPNGLCVDAPVYYIRFVK